MTSAPQSASSAPAVGANSHPASSTTRTPPKTSTDGLVLMDRDTRRARLNGETGAMDTSSRPVPVADQASAGYWQAASHGVLALAACTECERYALPPPLVCPYCGNSDPQWAYREVPGTGSIRSWTVVRDAFLPGFDELLPYVLVDVELDVQSGLRMIGRLLEPSSTTLHANDAVVVDFEPITADCQVPAFRLAGR